MQTNFILNKTYRSAGHREIKTFLLRLLTHVGFLGQNGLILSEVFLFMERSKSHEKKIYHNRAKKIDLPKEV